jgi:hypothetical protein
LEFAFWLRKLHVNLVKKKKKKKNKTKQKTNKRKKKKNPIFFKELWSLDLAFSSKNTLSKFFGGF